MRHLNNHIILLFIIRKIKLLNMEDSYRNINEKIIEY